MYYSGRIGLEIVKDFCTRFMGTVIKRRLQERPLPPLRTSLAVRQSIWLGIYRENSWVDVIRKYHRRSQKRYNNPNHHEATTPVLHAEFHDYLPPFC